MLSKRENERLQELRAERDDYVIGSPDGEETPDPQGWAREYPAKAVKLFAWEARKGVPRASGDEPITDTQQRLKTNQKGDSHANAN